MTPDMTKLINKRIVLDHLLQHGSTSRAEIARQLRLSKPTVSLIISELVREGIVRELGAKRSGQGRPSIEVEVNPRARYAVGVELDISSALIVITDLLSQPIPDERSCIKKEIDTTTPERAANSLATLIKEILTDIGCRVEGVEGNGCSERHLPQLIGVGIGVPAVVNSETMEVISSNPLNWSGPVSFGTVIQERVRAPVLVTQRVMAAAWAEYIFESAHNIDSLVYARFGSGVACGIILKGQLYTGANYFAGNISDVTLVPYNSAMDPIQPVKLKSLVTRDAITTRARQLLLETRFARSKLLDAAEGDSKRITLEMLCEHAVQGDPLSRHVILEAGKFIGIAMANLISILNPELIVLGGPLTLAGDILLDTIRDQVAQCCNYYERSSITISKLGDRASALGAANLALRQFLNPVPLPEIKVPLLA